MRALNAVMLSLLIALPALAGPEREARRGPRRETPEDRLAVPETAGKPVLIKDARILPVVGARLERGSILIKDGKIAAIGVDLAAPAGALVIEAAGKTVIPGIIDAHSHLAVHGGVNEMTEKMSPEVRIGDVIDHEDVGLYRAAAGGVTTAHLMHGSANPIGGQCETIKLRWGQEPAGLVFEGAPRTIKFALGENPTRRDGFPKTRQGVMLSIRRSFEAARAYQKAWAEHDTRAAEGLPSTPPRRDLRLETYVGILEGEILIQCHSYRSDEIVALMRLCEEYGVRVQTFHHVLDGYKVAAEMARHGAAGSTFSDWWAYKVEAFDAIPHNAAVMTRAGVCASINSDSAELIRHLNIEAAKSARYGGLGEQEMLALITLNPAKQLGIDERVGSLEVGKDADLAIYNGHPLSIFSRCVATMVDGAFSFSDLDSEEVGQAELRIPAEQPPLSWPARAEGQRLAIRGALIRPVSGPAFRGTLVVEGGRILALGSDAEMAAQLAGAAVVEAEAGWEVCPGFIDAGTQVGLYEVGAVEATLDYREAGLYQPDWVAIDAVHPHSVIIPVTRLCGTTTVLTGPRGGARIPGQASIIHLRGDVAAEMELQREALLVIELPSTPARGKSSRKREELEAYWERAKAYEALRAADSSAPVDTRLEALRPYLRGEKPVMMELNGARDIVEGVEWARARGLSLIIAGGRESWKVAGYLAKRDVPVLLGPVMSVPQGEFEPWDANYRCAAELEAAGVRFAIRSASDNNARILPFEAGMAAGHGLARPRALRAITLSAAEILGLAEQRGSLEAGKAADLIITVGHPLEPTSRVIGMLIEGQPVPLESRQTQLYERFSRRLAEQAPRSSKEAQ